MSPFSLIHLVLFMKTVASIPDMPDVVAALQEHLHSSSISLYFTADIGTKEIVKFQTLMKKTRVPISITSINQCKPDSINTLKVVLFPHNFTRSIYSRLFQDHCQMRNKWLIYLPFLPYNELLSESYIPVYCEVILFQKDCKLIEVYHLQNSLQAYTVGYWTHSGLNWTARDMLQRRSDLKNITIKAASINNPPITEFQESAVNGSVTVGGFFGEVWATLERKMNFRTEFFTPADNAWGSKRENGTWTGMISMIVQNDVDLAVSEFTITATRSEVVDFTSPLIYTRFCVIISHPGHASSKLTSFLAPFSTRLWLSILLAIFVISIYLTASNLPHALNIKLTTRFLSSMFYVFGIFCQQGQEEVPHSLSGRTMLIFTYITVTILPAAYSAALVSFLAVQSNVLPFTTLQGLLKHRSYQLAVLANSGQLNYFDQTKEPLMNQLYQELIEPIKDDLPPTVQEGLLRVCARHNYAFMTSLDIAMALAKHVPCVLVPVLGASIPDSLAMAMPKHSPYRSLINYNLQELRRSGVLARLRINAWPSKMPESKTEWTDVELNTVMPILGIVLGGIAAAIVCLLLEYIISKRRARSNYVVEFLSAKEEKRVGSMTGSECMMDPLEG